MAIENFIEHRDEQGNYLAVWWDPQEEMVILQYNFIHLTLIPEQFSQVLDKLSEAREKLQSKT